ncbi:MULTISPECIES: 2-aminoethylphosphonate--pyruvate transaminase [Pontibacillus]|uniref:2-aminoethylphosphonate--pyruvate transaminase n=1 Tax=Pontibacillus chungwhensis TaxID=265426 RepID=A0ABY8UXC2_9BACI|nr:MULTISPECIES: 2-aminoethylphosphonate--pyruvate transaminase [Pontibacillus]MCD5325779.1 2-aminoethylphosphonate--pyruvate transaminase [Pontibacillus sp. HN14]WIF98312.1 2-aminoethylphosphonate--pyruvate transaminase [Pontibacillus chungwhensis]
MNFYNDQNPYLLLTPGPLSTSSGVREAMLRDWCTWDDEYKSLVQSIRSDLLTIGRVSSEDYTTVLMQGSGTFSVESVLGTAIPSEGKLLVIANGAYGNRIATIAERLNIPVTVVCGEESSAPDLVGIERELREDQSITHVAVVHCETTTGMVNPIEAIGRLVKQYNKIYIVDAMSSFGGIEISMKNIGIDFLISSANKCIQGVPGFGFIIAARYELNKCANQARSLSLDLYDQWVTMEDEQGKWRFTSPTHTVHAFKQALEELKEEGGITARGERYRTNQRRLVRGMRTLGFETLLPDVNQSPIITSFLEPVHDSFRFQDFYMKLKEQGFVIYPGKVTNQSTFRIGNIGAINEEDIERLLEAIEKSMYWLEPIG